MHTKHKLPVWALVLLDLAALGAALIVFALFHHVLPRRMDIPADRPVSAVPAPAAAAPKPSAVPSAAPAEVHEDADNGQDSETAEALTWGELYASMFSEEITITDTSYSSPNVSVTVTELESGEGSEKQTCYVADIYLTDVRSFRSYLAQDSFGRGQVQGIERMSADAGAIAALTGDMYAYQGASLVLRNGELYRDGKTQTYQTHCVLYYDGTMEVYDPNEIDLEEVMANGAWQIWSFGPVLLRDGAIPEEYSGGMAVASPNPRAALGYYAPGHYCFVVVDGRQPGYAAGMTYKQLSALFQELGCDCAYNLDGGGSAAMTLNGTTVNHPSGGGRYLSDILLISEIPEAEEATEE